MGTKVVRCAAIVTVCAVACRSAPAADRAANRMTAATPAASPSPAAPSPVDCRTAKCLALTFDDGPGPDTPRLLDLLRWRSARATFFVLGRNAAAEPALLRRMVAEHHEIANHGYSHANLVRLSNAEIRREIELTQEIVFRATGQRPRVMRPPYGATNARVGRVARLPQIMWRIDTRDWLHRKADSVCRTVLKLARRGAVVLVHDTEPATVDAMPATVDGLLRRGYTLVTVSELYRSKRLLPGRAYAGN